MLKLDWCSFEAANHACQNWHYSKVMPAGKTVKVGAWEDGKFIGCVIFSRGANNNIGKPYNLKQTEICELTRVALNKHKAPVSQILAYAIKMLKKNSPGIKLIISYADKEQEHHGGIYQATNWIYTGVFGDSGGYTIVRGKKVHNRTIYSKIGANDIESVRKKLDKNAMPYVPEGKHKYLFPLTDDLRETLSKLSKPYPKREKKDLVTTSHKVGGAIPTLPLQNSGSKNAKK